MSIFDAMQLLHMDAPLYFMLAPQRQHKMVDVVWIGNADMTCIHTYNDCAFLRRVTSAGPNTEWCFEEGAGLLFTKSPLLRRIGVGLACIDQEGK